jgi:hypothetical protein
MAVDPKLVVALQKAEAAGDHDAARAIAAKIAQQRSVAVPSVDQPAAPAEPAMSERKPRPRVTMTPLPQSVDEAKALGETALTLGTGAIAAPVSGLVGAFGGLTQALQPGDQTGRAARWQKGTQEALTYEPKTEAGKGMVEAVAKPFEYLEKGADIAGDVVGGSSPLAETTIKTILLSAPMTLLKGAKTSKTPAKTSPAKLPTVRDIADTPDKKARRMVAEALERDGLTPDEAVAKLQALGPEARLADLGENLAGLARASTAKPGPARTVAKDFLEQRQAGQQSRLIDTAGLKNVKEFKEAFGNAMRDRHSKAAPLYDEAYNAPLDLSAPQMQALLQRPTMQTVLKDAAKVLADEGGGTGHVRLMDAAKRSLDDKIGTAIRSGKRDKARRLTMLKNQLLEEVDRQVPAFKQARNAYAGEAAMRDSALLGRNIMTKKLDLDDTELMVRAMGEGERHAFQMGVMRGLVDKLEGTATGRNAAGKLIESTRAREVLKIAFPDEAALNKLVNAAEAESKFSGTRQTVRGGSPTARIQQEVSGLEGTANVAAGLAQGNYVGTARQLLKSMGFGKVSDKTLGEVGRLLFEEPKPPEGMRFNPRGELIANPSTRSGRTIPRLPQTGPMGAAYGGVVTGERSAGMPNLTGQTDDQRRRQMLADAMR